METSTNDRSNKVTLPAVTVALVAGAIVAVAFSSAARSADLQLDDLADRPATEIAEFAGYEITPEQSAAFSDDAITDSERVEAFDAWLECVEEAGYRVISSELRYFGESLQVEDPKDTSGPAIRECRERLYAATAIAHRVSLDIPDGAAAEIQSTYKSCLADDPHAEVLSSAEAPQSAAEAYCTRVSKDTVLGRPER